MHEPSIAPFNAGGSPRHGTRAHIRSRLVHSLGRETPGRRRHRRRGNHSTKAADAHQLPRDGDNGLHHFGGLGSGSGHLRGLRAPTLPRPFCPKRRPAIRSPHSLRAMTIGWVSTPKMQPGTSQAMPTSAPSVCLATPLRHGPPPPSPSVKLAPITPTSPGPAPRTTAHTTTPTSFGSTAVFCTEAIIRET